MYWYMYWYRLGLCVFADFEPYNKQRPFLAGINHIEDKI